MKITKRQPPPAKGKRKLDTRNTKPTKILSKPCYRAARKFASITTLGKRQPFATATPQTENLTSSSVTSGKKEIPNVTDFLTFLCYRRTHALPAKLNFNKLFDVGTGEHQVRQKQELPHKKTVDKDKTLSWMGMDNNNKGDAFNMRVVLRKLFLGDDIIEETKDKKKSSKPKSVKNPPNKSLKTVQNGKSSKKCLKEETRRRKPVTADQRKKSTKAITSRKTEKLTKTAKTKSFNVPKSKQQHQRKQQKEARKTKTSSIVTRSNKKKKIKFIRN